MNSTNMTARFRDGPPTPLQEARVVAAVAILDFIKEHGVDGPSRTYLVRVDPSPRLPRGQWFVACHGTLKPISDKAAEVEFGPFEELPDSSA